MYFTCGSIASCNSVGRGVDVLPPRPGPEASDIVIVRLEEEDVWDLLEALKARFQDVALDGGPLQIFREPIRYRLSLVRQADSLESGVTSSHCQRSAKLSKLLLGLYSYRGFIPALSVIHPCFLLWAFFLDFVQVFSFLRFPHPILVPALCISNSWRDSPSHHKTFAQKVHQLLPGGRSRS
jgi:hypothetical protein